MLTAGSAARRVSLASATTCSGPAFAATVAAFLRQVDAALQQSAPAWVGHCKLLVSAADSSAYASITAADDEVRWSGTLAASFDSAEITAYAAIYNLSDAQVAAALDAHLAALALE